MLFEKYFLKTKHRKLLKKMDKLSVTERALNQYRMYVRGNRDEGIGVLIKKLKRNVVLGKNINRHTVRFGNLYINIRENWIVSIYNKKGIKIPGCNINEKLKRELNVILGLEK